MRENAFDGLIISNWNYFIKIKQFDGINNVLSPGGFGAKASSQY